MFDFVLEKNIRDNIENLFIADDFYSEILTVNVDNENHTEICKSDSIYYLISKKIDIPQSAKLQLFSSNNYVITSKADFEFDSDILSKECFRDYINIRLENFGNKFIPFKLKFLRITPYLTQ